jgi:ATPase subunit of ABC transporter with duplicated ATPase domains
MQGAPALSVHNPGKRFGDRIAFQGVSFEVGYGEVFGFLGPNGAGKTTTVRTLGTLIAPTSGSATVTGIPLAPENGVEIRRLISSVLVDVDGIAAIALAKRSPATSSSAEVASAGWRLRRSRAGRGRDRAVVSARLGLEQSQGLFQHVRAAARLVVGGD